jgi:hypothetical protein
MSPSTVRHVPCLASAPTRMVWCLFGGGGTWTLTHLWPALPTIQCCGRRLRHTAPTGSSANSFVLLFSHACVIWVWINPLQVPSSKCTRKCRAVTVLASRRSKSSPSTPCPPTSACAPPHYSTHICPVVFDATVAAAAMVVVQLLLLLLLLLL